MPINAHPDYIAAEKEYDQSQTLEEKIERLKKMISLAPGHKGAENLRAQLRTRLKKLISQQEKSKISKPSSSKGIKKEDMQTIIIGKVNVGKSLLLKSLTNAKPIISEIKFSTTEPLIGMVPFSGTHIQLIENPAINSEYYDKGIVNTTDSIIILITNLNQLEEIEPKLPKNTKKIIIFNNKQKLQEKQLRKINATLSSRRYNYLIIDLEKQDNYEELKEKLFKNSNKIRVFTKEPGKVKSPRPLILKPDSTVRDVAEKILKGFSKNIKETKIWGPSSKFSGQKIGLSHKLKDLDVVEFKTR